MQKQFSINVTIDGDYIATSISFPAHANIPQYPPVPPLTYPPGMTPPVSYPPLQDSIESILSEYELLPTTPEEQTAMEVNEKQYFKDQVNSLGTEAMYHCYKRIMSVSGQYVQWEAQMTTIAHLLDYSNPMATPFNPYTQAYRDALYSIVSGFIQNNP